MRGRAWLLAAVLVLVLLLVAPAVARAVRFKEGVDLALAPEMARALPGIEAAHGDAGIARGAFITSGREGKHKDGSLHPEGKAVDLRTRDLPAEQKSALAVALRRRLNGSETANRPYQVILESRIMREGKLVREEHLHVEYQPVAA